MIKIKQLASLSRITFSGEESEKIEKDMLSIVELMDTLKHADILYVDDNTECAALSELIADEPIDGISAEVLVSQSASDCGDGKMCIPKVVE
jgi:aspartyl/glutamyl-tRNA(Asn/Gln) amidotransferase C subunit